MDTTTPQVTEAELDRRAAECERFATLVNSRHRVKKAKRHSHKTPMFVLTVKPQAEGV